LIQGGILLISSVAKIRIKNLRLRTFIGIKEDEIKNKQDVVVNVEIHYLAERATHSIEIDDALNYRPITKAIIHHVEENRFELLERLTAELLELAIVDDRVVFAEVEVDKPHALRFADSVSMALAYTKD
jgi:D-erythro-7,8-dihydroneopterin triphosphate epimerase